MTMRANRRVDWNRAHNPRIDFPTVMKLARRKAFCAETAAPLHALNIGRRYKWVELLESQEKLGILKKTADGRYYLEPAAYRRYKRTTIIASVVSAAAIAVIILRLNGALG